MENDRLYSNRTYFMPADEAEQTRLAVVHQAYLPVLEGNLTLAVVPQNAERILDIGTGTGDWAIAMADRFPEAEITATDITATLQPSSAPPNVFFELDDASEDWAWPNPFDFIHIRGLMGAFTDWNHIYAQAGRNLKRGGSLEVADMGMINLTVKPSNSHIEAFNLAIQAAARKATIGLNLDHLQRPAFEASGLSVVKTKSLQVPLGIWSPDPRKKHAGKMTLIAVLEGLEAMSLRLLTRHTDMAAADVRILCEKVKEEVQAVAAKPWVNVSFVVARKIL